MLWEGARTECANFATASAAAALAVPCGPTLAAPLALNMFCQYIYMRMYVVPAADLYRYLVEPRPDPRSNRLPAVFVAAERGRHELLGVGQQPPRRADQLPRVA